MIAYANSQVINQWRRQLGSRQQADERRPLGAQSYLTNGPVLGGLIEIKKLVLVALYDEQHRDAGVLCLKGFSARRVPWGVEWGGRQGNRFFKNLRLQPVPGARGRRIDGDEAELLQLGLQLNRQVERHCQERWLPVRRHLQLPRLWAGFRRSDVSTIDGDGPELAAVCRRRRLSAAELLQSAKREHNDLTLYPLDWVSHLWQQAETILADLRGFPRRQVFALKDANTDLEGCCGASAFDFSHHRSGGRERSGRLRSGQRRGRRRRRGKGRGRADGCDHTANHAP